MQFTPDRAIQIIEEKKTQTRRPVHEGDYTWICGQHDEKTLHYSQVMSVTNGVHRVRFERGKTYAVQPGRGKPALFYMPGEFTLSGKNEIITPLRLSTSIDEAAAPVLQARIRLLEIWREDVRNISLPDSHAEGFEDEFGFLIAWCGMYDPKETIWRDKKGVFVDSVRLTIVDLRKQLARRPKTLYMAWALRFELVK